MTIIRAKKILKINKVNEERWKNNKNMEKLPKKAPIKTLFKDTFLFKTIEVVKRSKKSK